MCSCLSAMGDGDDLAVEGGGGAEAGGPGLVVLGTLKPRSEAMLAAAAMEAAACAAAEAGDPAPGLMCAGGMEGEGEPAGFMAGGGCGFLDTFSCSSCNLLEARKLLACWAMTSRAPLEGPGPAELLVGGNPGMPGPGIL